MSKLGKLHISDFLKGLILAIITAALTVVYTSVQSGSFAIDWKIVLSTAATAAIAYLLKNIGTNSDGQFLKKETDGTQG